MEAGLTLMGVILSAAAFQAERRACPEQRRRDLAGVIPIYCRASKQDYFSQCVLLNCCASKTAGANFTFA